jgi:uncharacterized protein YndB with AHSA1/START domain
MTRSTVTHDTFVIERTYDSPVGSVFRAWADPMRKARWFAGSAAALGNGEDSAGAADSSFKRQESPGRPRKAMVRPGPEGQVWVR